MDVFFVIAGFLTAKSIQKTVEKGKSNYFGFLWKRLIRLLPLVLLAVVVCLLAGYFLMLPDDYENLAESVIATNLFSNNILQCITTKNYWDVINNYKPLMHTWYVGVLFEAYLIIGLVPAVFSGKRQEGKTERSRLFAIVFAALSAVSLVLYLLPVFSDAFKFYLIPFRLYEIGFGCVIAYLPCRKASGRQETLCRGGMIALCAVLLCMMLIPQIPISDMARLLAVVCISCAILLLYQKCDRQLCNNKPAVWASYIGKASFSIYIWHQVLLAFFRYSIAGKPNAVQTIGLLAVIGVISALSYRFIERGAFFDCGKGRSRSAVVLLAVMFLLSTAFSGWVFLKAGVIRDVPELEITTENAQRGMHKKYNDAVYQMQLPFTEKDDTKILVIGDSFARDWVNILKESTLTDLDISYYYYTQQGDKLDCADRIERADVIFFSTFRDYEALPTELEERYKQGDVYVVGVKNFGDSNGIIYKNRWKDDYAAQTAVINASYTERNTRQKLQYAGQYVDMLAPVIAGENRVIVFTPECRFISQDCRHLTHAGAVFYAQILDLDWIAAKYGS